MNIVKVIGESLKVYKSDKWIIVFSMIPIFIGIVLYTIVGTYIYSDLLSMGTEWIRSKISADTFGSFIVYIMVTLLTVVYYFLISWTFTLIVSVIASPFNDVLSRRVEKAFLGEESESIGDSVSHLGKNFVATIVNEVKKISFILTLTIIAFLLSFIPVLSPLSLVISAYLMCASFLDYSWSRHGVAFAGCVSHIRKGVIIYALSGFLFLFLVSVPLLNLMVIPFGVIFFTIMYTGRARSA